MVTSTREQGLILLICEELVGPEAAGELRQALELAIAQPAPILIDVASARCADGAALALLISASRSMPASRPMAVVATPPLSAQLTEWRFDACWPVFEDREAALGFLGREV